MNSFLPNTTPVPHIVLRQWMPRLSDVELRVLIVVIDQTFGWVEEAETGRRKDRDWISSSQLVLKTGRARKAVSSAVKTLVETHRIIETVDESGRPLDTAHKRKYSFGKIFYRLVLREPPPTLFDNVRASKGHTVKNAAKYGETGMVVGYIPARASFIRTQKGRTTKETYIQKEIHVSAAGRVPDARKEDHKAFMEFWYETVQRTRSIKPVITSVDGKNLKRVLEAGVPEHLLEQIALFFLADLSFRKFSPTVATLCSGGILNGLLNRTRNDPEFGRRLRGYVEQFVPRSVMPQQYGLSELQAGIQQLAAHFTK